MSLLKAYLQTLTLTKAVNLVHCNVSYLLSRTRVRLFSHFPTFLSVEPANWCQLQCKECYVGTHRRKAEEHRQMTAEHFEQIISQTGKYLHTVQLFFQGEPTLNRNLPEIIRCCKKHKTVSIVSTNAQLIDRDYAFALVGAGLNKIIVSLDGLKQESYEQYRTGGNLQKVFDALQYLKEAKRHYNSEIEIELQCLLLKSNENEWENIRKTYKKMGATRLSFKTVQLADPENSHDLLPSDKRYSRYYTGEGNKPILKKQIRNRCLRLWSGCVITADGEMLPCCFDKSSRYSFGNVFTSGALSRCWISEKAFAFRNLILNNRKAVGMCNNCTE